MTHLYSHLRRIFCIVVILLLVRFPVAHSMYIRDDKKYLYNKYIPGGRVEGYGDGLEKEKALEVMGLPRDALILMLKGLDASKRLDLVKGHVQGDEDGLEKEKALEVMGLPSDVLMLMLKGLDASKRLDLVKGHVEGDGDGLEKEKALEVMDSPSDELMLILKELDASERLDLAKRHVEGDGDGLQEEASEVIMEGISFKGVRQGSTKSPERGDLVVGVGSISSLRPKKKKEKKKEGDFVAEEESRKQKRLEMLQKLKEHDQRDKQRVFEDFLISSGLINKKEMGPQAKTKVSLIEVSSELLVENRSKSDVPFAGGIVKGVTQVDEKVDSHTVLKTAEPL